MRAILLLISIVPMVALGWGETGHRAVCQIAYDELSTVAQTQVDRLIDLDPEFDNFADSCLFADGPPRIRGPEHYINVPRSYGAITKSECPMAETCLFSAIHSDLEVLGNGGATDANRLLALKLLGHWVGDMHQPMHVSFQDDLGGNLVRKKDDEHRGNLHSVWDFDIIAHGIGDDYSTISGKLRSEISDRDRELWKFDSPVEWANESYQITISAETQYCTQQQGACWYSSDNMLLSRGEPVREFLLSKDYLLANQDAVALRMKQAGVRLAALINSALK